MKGIEFIYTFSKKYIMYVKYIIIYCGPPPINKYLTAEAAQKKV